MRYQVPQFIEVEDKIFGPFTFRQFVYLIGAGGVCFIVYKTLPFFLGLPIMGVALAVGGALAFYKVNSRPLIETIEAAFKYMLTTRLYIWQKKDKYPDKTMAEKMLAASSGTLTVPKVSDSKLKDLAWSLDINESIYSKESKKLESRGGLGENLRV